MGQVLHLNSENFDETIAEGTVLVDFWAEWCGPCRMLGPVLDQVAEELGDSAKVAKINVDDSPDIAKRYSVRSLPALLVFRDGQIDKQLPGIQDKNALVSAVRD